MIAGPVQPSMGLPDELPPRGDAIVSAQMAGAALSHKVNVGLSVLLGTRPMCKVGQGSSQPPSHQSRLPEHGEGHWGEQHPGQAPMVWAANMH